MTAAPTSYDAVPYPSMLFPHHRPDKMGVIARLHGIAAAPADRARVLIVGGGDGLDAIALAAAFPQARFVNFDIAAVPVERGRHLSEAAGLTNIRHRVLDILDAAEQLDGPFDYIIAHGIYAWVPPHVRAALMPLFARLLAPEGVAMASYNAFPGAHTRLALRDMLLHHVRHLTDTPDRVASVRALLTSFIKPRDDDQTITAAMRREAKAALAQSDGHLFHDILNPFYAPQSLLAAATDGRTHGLRYLGDARGGGLDRGFVNPDRADISDAALLDRMQALDYENGRYFRASLFVRTETPVSRAIVYDAACAMWVSTQAVDAGDNLFRVGEGSARIADDRRADMLRRLIALTPGVIPVAELTDAPDLLAGLCHQALEGIVDLSTVPQPFAHAAPDRPIASALARAQIAQGEPKITTLDHRMVEFGDEPLRRLIGLLDGTRDHAELRRCWTGAKLDDALAQIAAKALLTA